MKIASSLGTSTKMEPSISLCRLTAYPIKILVANGAPSPNHANREVFPMPERISRFTTLVRDMRAAQKKYFATKNKEALNRALELEKKVDEQLAAIFDGIPTQGSLF